MKDQGGDLSYALIEGGGSKRGSQSRSSSWSIGPLYSRDHVSIEEFIPDPCIVVIFILHLRFTRVTTTRFCKALQQNEFVVFGPDLSEELKANYSAASLVQVTFEVSCFFFLLTFCIFI